MTDCNVCAQDIQEAFLQAPPLISSQIIDLSIQHPNWYRDVFEVEEFPRGNGTIQEQLVYRAAKPQIERGFNLWKRLNNNMINNGCNACAGPDCSYNWTIWGGYGLERKVMEMMHRDFRSPEYCISEIQTTAHFEQLFAKIVENLYAQVDFFKELNIGQNVLTQLAKKYVIDSNGAQPNPGNPYVYRNVGAARLATLNIMLLEFFYEQMRRLPDCVPYDVIDGSPIFSLECSAQLLSHLYRDDAQLRRDARFSGAANDLLMKYNFMSTIRGMFIAAPILYPRRFNLAAVTGEPIEVLPFVNDVPSEVGAYTGVNPGYELATHEEVLIHGKYPFKVYYMPTETTLGANSSFGPEYAYFNSWQWVNPQTIQDPFRRVGFFATSATIGISQQFSNGIFGVLVERPSVRTMAVFLPETACPPQPVECNNSVPATSCPCPLILSVVHNPVTPANWFIAFAVPYTVGVGGTILLGLDNGGYITATVVAVDATFKYFEVTFPEGVTPETCSHFTSVFCDDSRGCSADVLSASDCNQVGTVQLVLNHAIKAEVGEVITIYYGDGTTGTGIIVAVDLIHNVYVITTSGPLCQTRGICSVCVPPETDATCPACGHGPVITQCVS
jgi:hypothetical protein